MSATAGIPPLILESLREFDSLRSFLFDCNSYQYGKGGESIILLVLKVPVALIVCE
jgi:hypothetical protein